MAASAVLPGKPGVSRPAVRLREAELSDATRLSELYATVARTAADAAAGGAASVRPAPTPQQMREWLTTAGVLLVEDTTTGRPLAAVRYRTAGDGWDVDRIATLPTERGQGYGRWLMTKLEALAIRGNVKCMTLDVQEASLLPYYRRMGYRTDPDEPARLTKRVGGVWQRQELTR